MEKEYLTIKDLVVKEDWKKFMRKLDLFGAIFLLISLIMWVAGLTDYWFNFVLTLTLVILSIRCFLNGFEIFESESKVLSFLFYKIYGFGLAIGFITILFIKEKWSYPKEIMTIASIVLITIALLLGAREKIGENKNNIDWKYFLRIFIALIPLIYMITSNYKL